MSRWNLSSNPNPSMKCAFVISGSRKHRRSRARRGSLNAIGKMGQTRGRPYKPEKRIMEISEARRPPMMAETGVIAEKAQKAQAKPDTQRKVKNFAKGMECPFRIGRLSAKQTVRYRTIRKWGNSPATDAVSVLPGPRGLSRASFLDRRRSREEDSSVRRIHA